MPLDCLLGSHRHRRQERQRSCGRPSPAALAPAGPLAPAAAAAQAGQSLMINNNNAIIIIRLMRLYSILE